MDEPTGPAETQPTVAADEDSRCHPHITDRCLGTPIDAAPAPLTPYVALAWSLAEQLETTEGWSAEQLMADASAAVEQLVHPMAAGADPGTAARLEEFALWMFLSGTVEGAAGGAKRDQLARRAASLRCERRPHHHERRH